jgi:hypothetical protein
MEWVCPQDRHPLSHEGDAWRCASCDRRYGTVGDAAVFADNDVAAQQLREPAPALERIWNAVESRGAEDTAARLCDELPASRHLHRADWKFFLPSPANGVALELGAGYGDDSLQLVRSRESVLVVPHATNARIVERHLAESRAEGFRLAVTRDVRRLPLADGSVGLILLEDVAMPGFGVTADALTAIATSWRRVLNADGAVFLGVPNRMRRLPGAALLERRLLSRDYAETLNRTVKQAAGGSATAPPGAGATIRAMRRAGFECRSIYAPLPGEREVQIVIPVDDPNVVRYFLNNLVRRNSRAVRAAVALANVLVRYDLFRAFVPYYYLFFTREGQGA